MLSLRAIVHNYPLSAASQIRSRYTGLLNLVDKRLGVRLAFQKVLFEEDNPIVSQQRRASDCHDRSTHLERIHVVPAATHAEDLVTVQFPQVGIQWGIFEHRGIHVRGKYE